MGRVYLGLYWVHTPPSATQWQLGNVAETCMDMNMDTDTPTLPRVESYDCDFAARSGTDYGSGSACGKWRQHFALGADIKMLKISICFRHK